MDSSWSEVQHICDPNLSKVSPVSAVCWDPYHELLWVGNDSVSNLKSKLFTEINLLCEFMRKERLSE